MPERRASSASAGSDAADAADFAVGYAFQVDSRATDQMARLLASARAGDAPAAAELTPLVYRELHEIAARYLGRERAGHTLQPTALVNEAFLRLLGDKQLDPRDHGHFVGLAARAMRRILVEHARAHRALKRGEGARVELETSWAIVDAPTLDLVALDEALSKLAALDDRQARVVELRFFAGLSMAEISELLSMGKRAIELDWSLARAFLRRELVDGGT